MSSHSAAVFSYSPEDVPICRDVGNTEAHYSEVSSASVCVRERGAGGGGRWVGLPRPHPYLSYMDNVHTHIHKRVHSWSAFSAPSGTLP